MLSVNKIDKKKRTLEVYMIGSDLLHSDAELFMYIFRGFFFFGSIFFVNPLKYVLQGGRLDLDFL